MLRRITFISPDNGKELVFLTTEKRKRERHSQARKKKITAKLRVRSTDLLTE